jgi:hypothetical protein
MSDPTKHGPIEVLVLNVGKVARCPITKSSQCPSSAILLTAAQREYVTHMSDMGPKGSPRSNKSVGPGPSLAPLVFL